MTGIRNATEGWILVECCGSTVIQPRGQGREFLENLTSFYHVRYCKVSRSLLDLACSESSLWYDTVAKEI